MQRTLIYYLSLFALKYCKLLDLKSASLFPSYSTSPYIDFSSAASDRLLNSCADELALIANRSSEKGKERTPVSLVADVFVACDLTYVWLFLVTKFLCIFLLECRENGRNNNYSGKSL